MYKLNHEQEAFEIDRSFAFSGGSATAEQRAFDDWLRRIGGWISGTSTAARSQSDAPQVAQKRRRGRLSTRRVKGDALRP